MNARRPDGAAHPFPKGATLAVPTMHSPRQTSALLFVGRKGACVLEREMFHGPRRLARYDAGGVVLPEPVALAAG